APLVLDQQAVALERLGALDLDHGGDVQGRRVEVLVALAGRLHAAGPEGVLAGAAGGHHATAGGPRGAAGAAARPQPAAGGHRAGPAGGHHTGAAAGPQPAAGLQPAAGGHHAARALLAGEPDARRAADAAFLGRAQVGDDDYVIRLSEADGPE